MKHVLAGVPGRLDVAEEKISTHQDTAIASIQNETAKKKE